MGLGENLRGARTRAELSQEALARKSDCSTATVVRTERGATIPRADALARMAKVLETTVEELLDNELMAS